MTVDITSIIAAVAAVAALILMVLGVAWRMGNLMGGLKESVANSTRASSEAHANIGQRIDETRADIADVRQRVDRVLDNQAASGGDSSS